MAQNEQGKYKDILENHFDIMSILLAVFGGSFGCLKDTYRIVIVRLIFTVIDSAAELLYLCLDNKNIFLDGRTTISLFAVCLASFVLFIIFLLLLLIWKKEKNTKILSAFYKMYSLLFGSLLTAYAAYIWDRYEGNLFVFVIAVIDVSFDFLEIGYMLYIVFIRLKLPGQSKVENCDTQTTEDVDPCANNKSDVKRVSSRISLLRYNSREELISETMKTFTASPS